MSVTVLFDCHCNSIFKEDLPEICVDMLHETAVNGSTEAVASLVRNFAGDQCINVTLDDTSVRDEKPNFYQYRQKLYQRCTQLGWFSTTSEGSLFETQLPLDKFTAHCVSVFGSEV